MVWLLISDEIKIELKIKEGNFIMIKISIHQDITITNVYAPNNRASKHMKQNGNNSKEK